MRRILAVLLTLAPACDDESGDDDGADGIVISDDSSSSGSSDSETTTSESGGDWDLSTCEGVRACVWEHRPMMPDYEHDPGIFDCFPSLDPDAPEPQPECECLAGTQYFPTFCSP